MGNLPCRRRYDYYGNYNYLNYPHYGGYYTGFDGGYSGNESNF